MKTAFSTIATPTWTFERVAALAGMIDVDGVELRTFGTNTSPMVCEPWMTGAEKIRSLFANHGTAVSTIATSIRYDQRVFPPVIGHALVLTDTHPSVRDSQDAISLAASLEAPYVRVYGFEVPENEPRHVGIERISQRLRLALACARHTGVRLVLENGGSYPTATDLIEIIDGIDNPLLGASYSTAVAIQAGEDPAEGVRALGDRLACVKLRDLSEPGEDGTRRQVQLGTGSQPLAPVIGELARGDFGGWLIVEHDRLWTDDPGPDEGVEETLRGAFAWLAATWSGARNGGAVRPAQQTQPA